MRQQLERSKKKNAKLKSLVEQYKGELSQLHATSLINSTTRPIGREGVVDRNIQGVDKLRNLVQSYRHRSGVGVEPRGSIDRLEREKEKLLSTGIYTTKDPIILELDLELAKLRSLPH
jgi:hypothetical protein